MHDAEVRDWFWVNGLLMIKSVAGYLLAREKHG